MDKEFEWIFIQRRYINGHQVDENVLSIISHQRAASENHSDIPHHTSLDVYNNVHNSIIHNRKWKKTKYPSIDELINKMLYIHTMEYCLITTGNEVLIHTTTQTNFENIILTKRIHSQKTTYDSIYTKCSEQANSQRQKQIGRFLGTGGQRGNWE